MKMKHNNKGFSLVELIVVIAIMAILGGVGTVGYSKYIENTNKKADMALVGIVMRAVETSAADISNTSFQKAKGLGTLPSVPVGFVILSEDGTNTVSVDSEGTVINSSQTETETFIYYDTFAIEVFGRTYDVSLWKEKRITYLNDGSANINRLSSSQDLPTGWMIRYTYTSYPAETPLLAGSTFTTVDGNTKTYNTSNSESLANALEAAFGSDYESSLYLKYDKWVNEGDNLSTYADLQETWARFMTLLETASGSINVDTNELIGEAITGLEDKGYIDENGSLTVSEESFMNRWKAPIKTDEFAFNGVTAVYSGARAAWNSYFQITFVNKMPLTLLME